MPGARTGLPVLPEAGRSEKEALPPVPVGPGRQPDCPGRCRAAISSARPPGLGARAKTGAASSRRRSGITRGLLKEQALKASSPVDASAPFRLSTPLDGRKAKALSPMQVTPSGIVRSPVRLPQFRKARSPIVLSVEGSPSWANSIKITAGSSTELLWV